MKFDTKIAVVLRDDLMPWQALNVTAFTVSGIAGTVEGLVGEPYEDGSGNTYLPMFRQPVMIFQASAAQMKTVYARARSREVSFSLFTEELFATGNDLDNRAAVKAYTQEDLRIVGMAMWAEKKSVDKVLSGLPLHP
ncbi:DUF2000 domain-containing protein [Ktedonosporobacter rubrisoli]|uniref:DUF2000 domain-containing protein n=1 Tax=Ktedonosporobacter rubrisoli TaxID=2509675 RepID=A0A4V0YZF7_KTERU|nr:DUF2000 domain-containing protein [Ktedonosporobacter rubrisoli]QBD79561.1 DUF2000 domain-containing protein [Ktedonosporobacter rubrisoli]